ncbi:MAG: SurA N-terminal domain-containing protein [Deltaproteobacteria bacterium]|nr:SurA N-terminal domain-containing protein [Deltaproteobacteria bacterium]
MLDLLRKRAQSWGTLALFAIVILVFVFFFGYTDIGPGGGPGTAAKVNGSAISQGEFQLAMEHTTAFYREIFKDGIPEPVAKGMKSQAMEQLINQHIRTQAAQAIGLRVTDEELAEKIRALPYLQKDGTFDIELYKEIFLPQLKRRYSVDFENILRNELLSDKYHVLLKDLMVTPEPAVSQAMQHEGASFSFEVVILDSEGQARELLAVFDQPGPREKLLKAFGLAVKTVGPIALSEYRRLFEGIEATPEAYMTAFGLIPEHPVPTDPIRTGNRYVVLRLLSRQLPLSTAGTAPKEEIDRLRQEAAKLRLEEWFGRLRTSATVRSYVDLGEP